MPSPEAILQLVHRLARSPADLPLQAVAEASGWSAFHLHRHFRAAVGETPRTYQLRLRLQRALALLATSDAPVRRVAEEAGFGSHAVFARTFREAFGCTPSAFRARTREVWTAEHAGQMLAAGRCVGLHAIGRPNDKEPLMPIDVRIETRDPRPTSGQRAPFARYPEVGRGLLTVECGMPLVAPAEGTGEIEAGELFGGSVAVAVHRGPYEALDQTHAAVETWLAEHGHTSAGAPWESYVTDPADVPDPADWLTEVCWPVR